jgi:hypothetical protein
VVKVDDAAGTEELAVPLQEQRTGEARILALELRVGKGQPDFGNFVGGEKGLDKLDPCAEEGHIGQLMQGREFSPFPKACSLDVHPDVVALRDTL